jgi:predicted GNAT family acetyltransferase
MQIHFHDTPQDFLDRAGRDLEAAETTNPLILGVALRLADAGEAPEHAPLLCTVEEDDGEIALVAVRTPPHKLLLYASKSNPDDAVSLLAEELYAEGWDIPAVLAETSLSKAFAEAWSVEAGCSFEAGMAQRTHVLHQIQGGASCPGIFREAEEADTALVKKWLYAFHCEAMLNDPLTEADIHEMAASKLKNGDIFFWCDTDEQPVSMALKTRPTPRSLSVGGVYTPPELRNQGFATACVAYLSQFILGSGKEFCCLFTDLSNPTSNSIYRQIGYEPVCDLQDLVFSE